MTITLYGRPHSGSLAVEILLEELGVPYSRVLVTGYRENIQPPSFAAINPLRQVPALTLDDGTLLTESAAMMLLLADSHPAAGLAPAPDARARAPYLRWMTYLAATIYPTAMHIFHPENYIADQARFGEIKAYSAEVLAQQWRVVDGALGEGGHLAGDRLSAADLYMAMFALWFADTPGLGDLSSTRRFLDAMKARPSVQAVVARTASNEAWAA